ncbi:inositol phospholipid synthesis and fat-storage-inducing TM-domain-containing protein [Rhodofomes roseus]|uniref:Inositol phospholipid synthesis and fat-storage-inducing TM-domain-containing protein n=1 Tax=Rhodofomes roseus TaxID=34475 RepID=A0ABQ8K348_9APHY|nr:inositol phospholipid synthesis and fat-storage-inducing TM-domain-containing protein [Rhodofomes roseus]KAH9831262.1 inositol phospholipid synthesis and fat-storage-inducing TM-domain-containing protein [Rhodofomes roseus]
MPGPRIAALITVTAIVGLGTLSSVVNDSYLDTSNPLLTALPHPLHATHYFADKKNTLNVYFIKRIWGWTTVAFLSLFFTSPPGTRRLQRLAQYAVATAVWLVFTSWFFGPAVLERLIVSTGGECVVSLPNGAVVSVPNEFCYTRSPITTGALASLLPSVLILPEDEFHIRPRLRRGHDVSGHIFLLTMSILFLVDQLRTSLASSSQDRQRVGKRWPPYHKYAVTFNAFVVLLSLFATYTTSVYFHTPIEKLTGYLLGVAGFAVTQIPTLRAEPEIVPATRRNLASPAGGAATSRRD